jgi:hypothetical protein
MPARGDGPGRVEKRPGQPMWLRFAVIGSLLLIAFFGARNCQESQVEVTEEQAIEIARGEIGFEPDETQIRLLRQGINREPFWFVSLAVTSERDPDVFTRLAVVRVDAENGEVLDVEQDRQRDKEAAEQTQGEQPPQSDAP